MGPGSGFATAEKSVYLIPLCKKVAATFKTIFEQAQQQSDLRYLRAARGMQSKASKAARVVAEHKQSASSKAQAEGRISSHLSCRSLDLSGGQSSGRGSSPFQILETASLRSGGGGSNLDSTWVRTFLFFY